MSGMAANLGVAEIADRFPEVTIVLGHGGLATEQDDTYRTAGSAALAAGPNVVVKISALASGTDPDWTPESLRPWVLGAIDAFGPEWAMLATNWPIHRLHGSYVGLVNAHRLIIDRLPPTERAAVLPALRPASTASLLRGVKPNLLVPGRRGWRGAAQALCPTVPRRDRSRR